ncbi:hypothetical protein SCHPADRAFT_908552 [Schizopora paradoxa]|uniref:Thioredoxin-like fold domain-containing protein n=1 Tax=Schizopora paradoxa TaxID=27342 RepID=A0A0H2RAV7_9AGAM|nr:hypothetical protein SCHPADRAFT_908552 [Schizopora paradoxa]
MAFQPSLRPLVLIGPVDAPHTLDIFLDYVCPFSAKIAKVIETSLIPLIKKDYNGKVKVIFRNQVQPWHSSSTLVHEAGLAVARVSPENFWPFSLKLFEQQTDFFDIPSSSRTPVQTREKLVDLAISIPGIGASNKGALLDLLAHKTSPNGGVAVTDELKYTIKFSRQNGIHVSPTVLWDGLVANEVSSSWGVDEWSKFLKEKVSV